MSESKVLPALTAEEWAVRKRPQYFKQQPCIRLSRDGTDLSISEDRVEDGQIVDAEPWVEINDPASRHALAALALYQQPFGFTREDLKVLEHAEASIGWKYEEEIRSLANRIEALLPPEASA